MYIHSFVAGDFTNMHEIDTKNAVNQKNNLQIIQSVVSYGI